MRSIQLLFIFLLSFLSAKPQSNFIWADHMGGTGSDAGWAIATDNSGNIYTTGFFNNTVDFDPGSGTMNLVSNGMEDIFISKTDASGNLLWAKRIGGSDGDRGFGIAVDAAGNSYVTGAFVGTVDFDPGPGISNMTSGSTYGDMYIVKLDASGNLSWAKQFGGSGGITGYSIAVDAAGNTYTTGAFTGTIDFDPGAGTLNYTNTGSYDIFVCKTSNTGSLIWARQMGGTTGFEDNISNAIAVDAAGNVYTTGAYEDTTDFDPGAGTYLSDSTGFFISKLNASGNFAWAKFIVSQNLLGNSLAIDVNGDLLIAGSFSYSADFDPGAGTFYESAAASRDAFVLKLNSAGNFFWMKQLGSATGGDNAYSVTTDASANVYSTGSFQDVADFDPGSGTFTLSSNGADDIFISKLDMNGNFICAAQMGGTDVDYAYGIDLDATNNIYIAGAFMNTVDFNPGTGTDAHTSAGLEDIFISTISDCSFSVGLPEHSKQEIEVYPNPAKNTVMLSGEFISADLLNVFGEIIATMVQAKTIDISGLGSGVYLLKVNTAGGQIIKRFVKS